MEEADQIELHIFCDVSQDGYGVVAYLRICKSSSVHIKFVIGKSRLTPITSVSIPRLELEGRDFKGKIICCHFKRGEKKRLNDYVLD